MSHLIGELLVIGFMAGIGLGLVILVGGLVGIGGTCLWRKIWSD